MNSRFHASSGPTTRVRAALVSDMHGVVRSMGPREGPFLLHVRRPCWKHDSLYHINREKKSTFLAPLA